MPLARVRRVLGRCVALLLAIGSPALAAETVLRVGTSGDYPPFSKRGEGFDIAVAERLARDLGARIEWIPFRWPELHARLRAGDFDLVMSGVTWRPERSVVGWMTRAVAAGGPCVVGAAEPARVAVNRGGALEVWARRRFGSAEILAVDDNLSLPERLARGEVDGFVTDSFELPHFQRPGWPASCEPPVERKVYWVAPERADELGPAIDAWLVRSEPELCHLRQRWLGAPAPRDGVDHLVDLLARRLALMPAVAAWKRAHGRPIEDRAREARVLESADEAAHAAGLGVRGVRELFRVQIELARRVQGRSAEPAVALDLEGQLRPALLRLGERIVAALAEAAPLQPQDLGPERTAPLAFQLEADELRELRAALLAVRPAALERTAVFRAAPANSGVERYSAWFGDSDGRVLYFGLSPFWELWWATDGDSRADLIEPGDHLIGRFDLERETFLPPLRVRARAPDVRSSVWDVLAHSNGRIYYTTYFEEIGSVGADGRDPVHFEGVGRGFNELYEGPDGSIYATRYSDAPESVERQSYGAVAVLSPDGTLLREFRFPAEAGRFTAPKSVAVDPLSGEIWVNTDTFGQDGSISHETLRLAPDGRLLGRSGPPPELHFARFDRQGRGWFAEDFEGQLRVRVLVDGRDVALVSLGPRARTDFVQDIKPTPGGGVVVGLWSGRAYLIRPQGEGFGATELRFELPARCAPPKGRSLLYTAVVHGDSAYATLFCGPTVLRAPLP